MNKLVDSGLRGFRFFFLTTQLAETVYSFAELLNNQGKVDVVFLNFSKLFDCVLHSKLLIKPKTVVRPCKMDKRISLPVGSNDCHNKWHAFLPFS